MERILATGGPARARSSQTNAAARSRAATAITRRDRRGRVFGAGVGASLNGAAITGTGTAGSERIALTGAMKR